MPPPDLKDAIRSARRSSSSGTRRLPPYPSYAELQELPPHQRLAEISRVRRERQAVEDAERAELDPYDVPPERPNSAAGRAAETLVQMLNSGEEGQAEATEWLRDNRGTIDNETADHYGLRPVLDAYDESIADEEDAPLWKRGLAGAARVLEPLGRPGQAAMEALQETGKATGLVDFGDRDDRGGWGDVWRALRGEERWDPVNQTMTRNLSLGSAVDRTRPDGWTRYPYDAFQFGGEVALDPLNLIGGPGRKAAEAGASVAARTAAREGAESAGRTLSPRVVAALGDDFSEAAISRQLRNVGLRRGLTEEGHQAAVRELAETGTRTTRSGRTVPLGRRGERLPHWRRGAGLVRESDPARAAAQRQMDQALRYDRGGLRVGGRSLVGRYAPEGSISARSLAEGLRLIDTTRVTNRGAMRAGILEDAARTAEELTERSGRYNLSDEAIDEALGAATNVSYTAESRAAGATLRAKRDAIVEEGNHLLRNALINRDEAAVVDALEGLSVAGIPGTKGLAREVRENGLDPDTVTGLRRLLRTTRVSYKVGERGPLAGSRLQRGAANRAELATFDAERIVNALRNVDRETGEGLDALMDALNTPSNRRVPGQRDAYEGIRAWDAAGRAARGFDDEARRIREAIDSGDINRVMEVAPGAGRATAVSEQIVRHGIAPNLRQSGRNLVDAITPRGRIRRSRRLDEGKAEEFYRLRSAADARSRNETHRRNRAIGAAVQGVDDAERAIILDALEAGDAALPEVTAGLSERGMAALRVLQDERERMYRTLVDDIGVPAGELQNVNEYMARYFLPEVAQMMRRDRGAAVEAGLGLVDDLPTSAAGEAAQRGHLQARTQHRDLPLPAASEAFARDLGLPEGMQTLELDPAVVLARRGQEIDRAASLARFADEAQQVLRAPDGGEMVRRVRADAPTEEAARIARDSKARGLVEVDLGAQGGKMFVHPDIKDDVARAISLVEGDEAVAGFRSLMDRWNRLFKGSATVPLVSGPSFFSRNATGNVMANYMAGVRDINVYRRALSAQDAARDALKKHPGLDPWEAMRKEGGKRAEKYADILEAAYERGVIGEGFFSVELPRNTERGLRHTGRDVRSLASAARVGANPLNSDNWMIRTGSAFNSVVEDNARLAHFMAKYGEIGDLDEAAASVKKYLFDYADLTDFERRVGQRGIAFWTFMRKNTSLQARLLMENPARVMRAERGAQALVGSEDSGGDVGWDGRSTGRVRGQILPEWAAERGTLMRAGAFGTTGLAVGQVDTPLGAAVETVEPLRLLGDALYGNFRYGESGAGAQDLSRALAQVPGGGPVELANIIMEESTGVDSFSGARLRDRDGNRKKNAWLRLSQALAPALDKAVRTYNLDDSATEDTGTRLLEALSGVQVRQISEEDSEKSASFAAEELRDALEQAKEEGLDVPSLADLRRAGIIPDYERLEDLRAYHARKGTPGAEEALVRALTGQDGGGSGGGGRVTVRSTGGRGRSRGSSGPGGRWR